MPTANTTKQLSEKQNMSIILFQCIGGTIVLPDSNAVLIDRADGGNLVINPPRPVWERSELTRDELIAFSCLVAAAGSAMLETLPQLTGGCLNYWEAGNWGLNDNAEPRGRKLAREHRTMHLHLLGRNPRSTNIRTQWGEAPIFPKYAERESWAANYQRLHPDECVGIVTRTESLLLEKYAMSPDQIYRWTRCSVCGYPCITDVRARHTDCAGLTGKTQNT